MKTKTRLLFFLIGVVGMIVMFVSLDSENIPWEELFNINTIYLFLGLLAIWLVIYSLHTLSYFVVLGKDAKKIGFFGMLKICISGFALNSVTPAGLVGGEPYRIMEMKRRISTEKAVSSTLTFSMFYVMGHVVAWLATVVVYACYGLPGELYITIVLMISGAVCLGAVIFFLCSKRKGFVKPIMTFFGKLPFVKKPLAKFNEKNKEKFIAIDNNIKDFRVRKGFWIVLGIQFSTRVLEALEYMVIFIYFGQKLNLLDAFLIFGTASLIANIIFIIPMQAGSREGGLFIALSFLAIQESVGSIACIVYRIRDLLCIVFGVILVVIVKRDKKEKGLEKLKAIAQGNITDDGDIVAEEPKQDDLKVKELKEEISIAEE